MSWAFVGALLGMTAGVLCCALHHVRAMLDFERTKHENEMAIEHMHRQRLVNQMMLDESRQWQRYRRLEKLARAHGATDSALNDVRYGRTLNGHADTTTHATLKAHQV